MTPHPEKRCSCARCNIDELMQLHATLNRHDLSPHHRLAQAGVMVRKLIARGSDGVGEGLSDRFVVALKEAEGKLRLDAVSGDGTWNEADARLREVERKLQKCKRRREAWKARASKYKQRLDTAHTRCDAARSELARTKRQLTTLRGAFEEILERWDDSEVSEAPEAIYRRLRTALASLDEQEGER